MEMTHASYMAAGWTAVSVVGLVVAIKTGVAFAPWAGLASVCATSVAWTGVLAAVLRRRAGEQWGALAISLPLLLGVTGFRLWWAWHLADALAGVYVMLLIAVAGLGATYMARED